MKCFKQQGWKGCTPAQRKRIVIAGVALAALIVAVVGGGTVLGLKRYKHLKKLKDEKKLADEEELLDIEEREELFTLDQAVRNGDIGEIQRLIDESKFFAPIEIEEFVLTEAVRNGDIGEIQRWIDAGFNVNFMHGSILLPIVAARGNAEVVKLLLDNNVIVSQREIDATRSEEIKKLLRDKMAEQQGKK